MIKKICLFPDNKTKNEKNENNSHIKRKERDWF